MKIMINLIILFLFPLPVSSQTSDEMLLFDNQINTDIKEYEKEIEKLKSFTKLRNERRDLLAKIPKVKSEQIKIEANIASIKTELEDIRYRLQVLQDNKQKLADYKERLDELTNTRGVLINKGKQEGQSQEEYETIIADYEEQIKILTEDIDYYKNDLNYRYYGDTKSLETKKQDLDTQLGELNKDLINKNQELEMLQDELEIVEDNINTLLIPTTAQNEFKLFVTYAFTGLVGVVIVGFFIVSFVDSNVRRAIFSSQSGIQFITLFSLVIAIILFGITDILGGKELAALLGGISGYILGRVSDNRVPDSEKQVTSKNDI